MTTLPKTAQGTKRALVVEDDPSIRRLIQRYLAAMDVEVTDVADARTALARLAEAPPPDLLCLDLMLPDSSGYVLCQHVRDTPALRGVPILVISARNSVADRAHAEEYGVTHYLTKPFHRADFVKLAKGLLERAA